MLEERLTLKGWQDLFINGQPILTQDAKYTVEYRLEVLEKLVEGRSETVLTSRFNLIKKELEEIFELAVSTY